MVRGRRDWTHREQVLEQVAAGGCSLRSVAASFGVPYTTAVGWWKSAAMGVKLQVGARGGVGERLPPPREKSGRLLSSEDRAVIQAGLSRRLSLREIGGLISRDASVVSREIKRNSGPEGVYRAQLADRQAAERRKRPKEYKLADPELCRRIEAWMDEGWSPGLIAKVLAAEAGADHTGRVSHETIYQALYVQSRGNLRQDLARQLSTARTRRKPRGRAQRPAIYSQALRISQRPPEVADRAVPGHWEGDLIIGEGSRSAIGTLVERSTRFTILLHLPGAHTAEEVAAAMIAQMSQLPAHLRRSITWDRGTELARYADIQLDLQAPVYFADPHSPWQRGSNENTNRLLRFWFTKGSDLSLWDADAIRAYRTVLASIDSISGRAFNLGGGPENAVSLRQVLHEIAHVLQAEVAHLDALAIHEHERTRIVAHERDREDERAALAIAHGEPLAHANPARALERRRRIGEELRTERREAERDDDARVAAVGGVAVGERAAHHVHPGVPRRRDVQGHVAQNVLPRRRALPRRRSSRRLARAR